MGNEKITFAANAPSADRIDTVSHESLRAWAKRLDASPDQIRDVVGKAGDREATRNCTLRAAEARPMTTVEKPRNRQTLREVAFAACLLAPRCCCHRGNDPFRCAWFFFRGATSTIQPINETHTTPRRDAADMGSGLAERASHIINAKDPS